MRARWWHVVAASTVLSYASIAEVEWLPASAPAVGTLDRHLLSVLAILCATMAASLFVDQGVNGGRLAWEPSVGAWVVLALVPFANVAVGAAYCLRRWVGARRRPPGRAWVLVLWFAYGSHAAFLANALVLPESMLASTTDAAVTALGLTGWALLPGIVLVELFHLRGISSIPMRRRTLAVTAVVPVLNLLMVPAVVFKHDAERRAAEDDVTFDARAASEYDESPWFRRAGYVFAAALGVTLAALAIGPDVGGLASFLFVHLVWPPFGVAFVSFVRRDVHWQRRQGWDVAHGVWRDVALALVFLFAVSYLFERAKRSDRETAPTT